MSFAVRRLASTRLLCRSSMISGTSLPLPKRYYARPSKQQQQQQQELEPKFDLPDDPDVWIKAFKVAVAVNHRVSIRDRRTAEKIANTIVPEGSEGQTLIEAYPGPGRLTRALLELPKNRIKKLIVVENWGPYLQWLTPLQEADPRVEVLEMDPFNWATYSHLSEHGMLEDIPTLGWNEGVHSKLQFISHLPSTVYSEQLISQLFRSMPQATWLFKYGRVPLQLILSDYLYQRVVATPEDTSSRCKLSIVAECTAECSPILDYNETQPYASHFHPTTTSGRARTADAKRDSRSIGLPFRTMTVVPAEQQVIPKGQMDAWDFCLRRLYVKKSTALDKAINTLAPNAQILLKTVTDPELPESERLDVKKRIRDMSPHDWAILLKAFDEWPFKPQDLSIHEGYAASSRLL